MKKKTGNRLGILVILLVVLAATAMSCTDYTLQAEEDTEAMSSAIRVGEYEYIKVVEVDGHEYIIYDGYEAGGICHSESCPCKSE